MVSEWLAGKNPIKEALRAQRPVDKILIAKGTKPATVQDIKQMAKERGIVTQFVNRQKLNQLAGNAVHQGVLAAVAAHQYAALPDVLERAQKRNEAPFLVVLDQLEDPHNLGSILRTADATGVHGVVIPKRRSVGLTTTVAKASAGAIEYIPVVRVTNIVHTLRDLKQAGLWVTGAEASTNFSYAGVDYTVPTALVIGSEGKGLSRLVREHCDQLVHLPMKGHVGSLNASVAAALLMYEVYRHRQFSG